MFIIILGLYYVRGINIIIRSWHDYVHGKLITFIIIHRLCYVRGISID